MFPGDSPNNQPAVRIRVGSACSCGDERNSFEFYPYGIENSVVYRYETKSGLVSHNRSGIDKTRLGKEIDPKSMIEQSIKQERVGCGDAPSRRRDESGASEFHLGIKVPVIAILGNREESNCRGPGFMTKKYTLIKEPPEISSVKPNRRIK
jgi:hypothetical protein